MGITHFRSDVKEQGTRKLAFSNASIVTATINTLKVTGDLTNDGTVTGTGGLIAGSGTYVKLGAIYIITGAALADFTGTSVDAIATNAAGVALATSVPRGSLFLNASSNAVASHMLLIKSAPASWLIQNTGSII